MKSLWNSFKIAFAMFSKIPMPQAEWTKENMKYMFCFFPVIGAVIAAAVFALDWISRRIGIAEGFRTVILVLVPVFITGGIHVDGLLDTADALSSWQERERRLEILKDSHAGAFAVIAGCVYFLCCYGAYSQIGPCRTLCRLSCLCCFQMFFRTGSGTAAKGKGERDGGGIFQEGGRPSGQKYADSLSGDSGGGNAPDSSGTGRNGFSCRFSDLSLLQAYGAEIFRRNHRRPFRIFPLCL